MLQDSDFTLPSGVELGGRLTNALVLTGEACAGVLTLALLTFTDTLGTVKGRLQPYASSTLAKSEVNACQCDVEYVLTQGDLEGATIAIDI